MLSFIEERLVKKINIGIDIDGVINDLMLFNLSCGTKFSYLTKTDISVNCSQYDSKDIFKWSEKNDMTFWSGFYEELLLKSTFTRPFAAEVISFLKKKHKIYIITARKNTDLPKTEKRDMELITKMYLKNNNILYDKLVFSTKEKYKEIVKYNIDIMIEDNVQNINEIIKNTDAKVFCFNTPYNVSCQHSNIIRVYTWYDILIKMRGC